MSAKSNSPVLGGTAAFAPGGLFDLATRVSGLWPAWEKVLGNAGAAGGDGVTVHRFAAAAHNNLSRLSHDLRNGRYRPRPSRRAWLPKRDGTMRPLDIPSVVDRVAQTAVSFVLGPLIEAELEDASFAYRPGRSVARAVARVASLRRQGYRWVVDGDIRRYFEMVPHQPLLHRLDALAADAALVDLVALWLEGHGPEDRGLPQGSPLSPLLANLYLDAVDEAIEGGGVRLVRFADDFVLLTKSREGADLALLRMGEILAEHGLELHPEKTRLVGFDQGFRFLGHVFVRSMVWKEVDVGEDTVDRTPRETDLAGDPDGTDSPSPALDAGGSPVPRGRWAPGQRVLHAVEPGRRIVAEGEHLTIRDGEDLILDLPATRVDRIEVGPGVGFDQAVLDLAAAAEIPLYRVDAHGRTLGRWTDGERDRRSARHLAQAAAVIDEGRRAAFAHAFASARVANQRALVKRLNRSRKLPVLDAAAARIGRVLRKLDRPGLDVAGLMGHEGEAAAIYWPALAATVGPEWAFGGRRARRTNEDPVNILFDCVSSLLLRDVEVAVRRVDLHEGFSFLHTTADGEAGLAFDLAEEFRGPLVEACVLASIAKGGLRPDGFAHTFEGWRMGRSTWTTLIRIYEAWVARPIKDPVDGTSHGWRTLIERQAGRLVQAIENGTVYRGYRMDY